jgi:hypothetical protein
VIISYPRATAEDVKDFALVLPDGRLVASGVMGGLYCEAVLPATKVKRIDPFLERAALKNGLRPVSTLPTPHAAVSLPETRQ